MNAKYLQNLVMVLFGVGVLSGQASAQLTDNLSLKNFIDEALANNPKVQEDYHKWKAAELKIKSVKSLPDPMANYGYFGENVETRVGPQKQKYGLSQKIPFPGKLRLHGHAQKKYAGILQEQYGASKNEVIKNVKFVYYDLFWVDKAIQITEEEKDILENLEQVTRRKYEANLTPQQDVVKAQVELTKLTERLYTLNQNRKSLAAKMNTILNRDIDTEIQEIINIDVPKFNLELSRLIEMTKESGNELKISQLSVERAEENRLLAKMNYLPDFTFGVDYIEVGSGTTTRSDDGKDAWVAMVSVNLPIWFGKNNSQIAEKKSELSAAQQGSRNAQNTVIYEVQDLYFKMETYKDIVSLYKTTLIPQSEQMFNAAKSGYESQEVDFLNWLDAQKNLLQTKLAYYKSITDYLKSAAYLERVVGQGLYVENLDKGDVR